MSLRRVENSDALPAGSKGKVFVFVLSVKRKRWREMNGETDRLFFIIVMGWNLGRERLTD